MSDREAPKLEKPGAGLPALELLLVRKAFSLAQWLRSDARATRRLEEEAQLVLALARKLSREDGMRRVLVPRLTGLEDSSRHWSAYMVVEHLCIVNGGIIAIVEALRSEKPFGREVKIEDVKPSPTAGPEVLSRFSELTERYAEAIGAGPLPKTKERHAHPWFGPLDAHGWHCLAAVHGALHRRQLEAILERLPA
jgi:hypothetical protein